MVKALLWKEWRRLRALRFTLTGIGLAIPAAFSLAVWGAGHGWGMKAFSGYSMRTILLEAVPATLWLGLWPLAAMVFVVQAFTADRAEGTEAFLLDRAVSRGRIWLARWTASLGSLGVVAVVGVAMLVAFFAGYADSAHSVRGLVSFAAPGLVLILATSLAGLGATALLSAPLPAFLVALLLTASPVLAGVGGSLMFPYASWQGVPVAGLVACALALVMPLASWTADTHGEPAGRGRRLRAALVLGGGLVLSTLAFVLVAPFAVRADAPAVEFSFVAPPDGTTTLVAGERGFRLPATTARTMPSTLANGPAGFLVDLTDGRKRAFLPPEVHWAQWDAGGTKLVVLDNARPLGSVGAARLRFLDATGKDLWPAVEEPEDLAVRQAVWAGDRLAIVYEGLTDARARVDVLDPASGRQVIALDEAGGWFAELQAARDGRVYVYSLQYTRPGNRPMNKEDWANAVWSLRELDPAGGTLGSPLLQGRGLSFGTGGLSPSGRYWKHRTRTSSEVIEIAGGTVHPLPLKVEPEWMRDDSLVWLERKEPGWTLFRMEPGGSPRAWTSGPERDLLLKVSPDGTFAAITLLGPDGDRNRPVLVLEAAGEQPPRRLAKLASFRIATIEWAGPHTLAATNRGRLALYDVTTGKSTVVFGRP